jgi:streptogramin lyase
LHGGGGIDTFVTKLGPSSQRVYSTYLGGSGNETPGGITVDPAGNAYVTGDTIRRISRRPEPPSSPRMQEESQTDL